MPRTDELDLVKRQVTRLRATAEHDALVQTPAQRYLAELVVLHDALSAFVMMRLW